MSQNPQRYYATRTEITEIIQNCKAEFMDKFPQYKAFEDEIGSYVLRAVDRKNEVGFIRPDNYVEDQKAQADYFDRLASVAKAELAKCKTRFKDKLPKKPKHSNKPAVNNLDKDWDDYILVTNLG